jgi:hypothetical protein
MKCFSTLSVLLLSLAISHAAKAWTVMVLSSKPSAIWVNVKGEKTPLKVGQFLGPGDIVVTGAGTKVKLIENHSVMVIGENTNLKFSEPEKKDGPPSPVTITILNGKVRFKVDKTEAQKYKYRIPSIVAGVRGTEFVLTSSMEKEVLCVLEGEVGAEIVASGAKAVVQKNIGWIREGNQEGRLLPTTPEQRKSWVDATSI